jgi:hypothetical protein
LTDSVGGASGRQHVVAHGRHARLVDGELSEKKSVDRLVQVEEAAVGEGEPVAAVIGLVIDAIRNRVSRRIGAPPTVIAPPLATCTMSPRATAATTPGTWPCSTAVATMVSIRARASSSNPSELRIEPT